MGFLEQANTKYKKSIFVPIHSVDYMKGAYIVKMTTRDIIEMSSSAEEDEKDENDKGLEKVIEFIIKYIVDDKKNALDVEEAKEFFQEKPIGDLIKLQKEILKISGAAVDVDQIGKK